MPEKLREVIAGLQSLRGVAKIPAVTLVAELGQISRFDCAALGSVEGADLAAKAKAVVALAEAACGRVEASYQQARSVLQGALVQLSEASDAANRSSDISAAMAVLDRVISLLIT
ncbi:MAG: hypothetical protein ACREU3_10135 [Steroidobacteraceae bacterium]